MKIPLLLFILFCSATQALAGTSLPDSLSVRSDETKIRPAGILIPASLITVGAVGASNGWFVKHVDKKVKDQLDEWRGDSRCHFDDYLQYFPAVSHLGLSLLGVEAKHSYSERIAVLATSYLTLGILVNGIKYTAKRARPDSYARNSFPSGHTATAFMGAELVRIEYKNSSPWYGVGAYVIATGVACMRLYNERHWTSDVLAGAGIGILSARIGYWLLPFEKRLFHLKGKEESIWVACPYYDTMQKSGGVAFSATF